jgi:hypothetical protein
LYCATAWRPWEPSDQPAYKDAVFFFLDDAGDAYDPDRDTPLDVDGR